MVEGSGAVVDGRGRLGGAQRRRQLHGDVVVAAGGAAARAGGGVAAHHHATSHHLQPAPCNTPHIYVNIVLQRDLTSHTRDHSQV